jgi:hypothetical protein
MNKRFSMILIISAFIIIMANISSAQLIALWKMDEGTGSYVNDWGTGLNNGTIVKTAGSGPQWIAGPRPGIYGLQFSSSNNGYINAGNDPSLNQGLCGANKTISVAFWLKTTDSTTQRQIVLKTLNPIGDSTGIEIALNFNYTTDKTSSIWFWSRHYAGGNGYGGHFKDPVAFDGNWHHVAFVLRADSTGTKFLKGYLDGKEKTMTMKYSDVHTVVSPFAVPFTIATENNRGTIKTPNLNGSLAEIAIYDVNLTPTDVNNIYLNGPATGAKYDLTVNVSPSIPGLNTISPPAGQHPVGQGLTASISAGTFVGPSGTYVFDHWVGDVNNANLPNATILMNSDKTVTAVYTLAPAPMAVSYWNFNESNGTVSSDSQGLNNGSDVNSVGRESGVPSIGGSGARTFTKGTAVNVGTSPDLIQGLLLNHNSWSISAWIKQQGVAQRRYLLGQANLKDMTALDISFNMQTSPTTIISKGKTMFYLRDSVGRILSGNLEVATASEPNIYDGNWHHLVWVVVDAATNQLKAYTDGVERSVTLGMQSRPSAFTPPEFPIMLCADNNQGVIDSNYVGAIDEVAIYDGPLTSPMVGSIYASGVNNPARNTVLTMQSNIPAATLIPGAGTYNFAQNRKVLVYAKRSAVCPNIYGFSNWSGSSANNSAAMTTITMDSAKTLTGQFVNVSSCGDECHPYPIGDFSKDCRVSLIDFADLAQAWQECTAPSCDE